MDDGCKVYTYMRQIGDNVCKVFWHGINSSDCVLAKVAKEVGLDKKLLILWVMESLRV